MDSVQHSSSSEVHKATCTPYFPLCPERREIRLATLSPGNFDDNLVVQLRTESLPRDTRPGYEDTGEFDTELVYEALSYVWGSTEPPCRAQVNDRPFSIGKNLECALRHLRYRDRNRVLWIDALCIDQANMSERSSQVQLMGYVYRNASAVAIWLGPGDSDEEKVIMNTKDYNGWDMQAIELLGRICERPWFRRVWVLQEFLLARPDPIIYLGHALIKWATFSKFVGCWRFGLAETLGDGAVPPSHGFRGSMLPKDVFRTTELIFTFELLKYSWYNNSFAKNLGFAASCEAENPRDKIYGKLGLQNLSKFPIKITPDYTKSLCEVLVDTSKAIIEIDPIELYGFVPMQPLREENTTNSSIVAGLPSWASAFEGWYKKMGDDCQPHLPKQTVSSLMVKSRAGDAIRGLQGTKFRSLARFPGHGQLRTVGKFIGTILDSSENLASSTRRDDLLDEPCLVSADAVCHAYNNVLKPRKIPFEALFEAFCAVAEKDLHPRAKIRTTCQHLFQKTADDLALTREQCHVLVEISEPAQDQIVFVTSQGHVGLVYHPDPTNGIRRGDVVVGLFGINIPFVLRQASDGKSYEMINIAYVGGHTYSQPALVGLPDETTENDVWDNLEAFGLEEYTIV